MKRIIITVLTVILIFSMSVSVAASGYSSVPYNTYEYDSNGSSSASPVGYVCEKEIKASHLSLDSDFNSISDIQYFNNMLFLLDSLNNRIIVLNADFSVESIYNDFIDNDGSPLIFAGAKGFAVDNNGKIYIADTANTRILVFDNTHKLERIIERPDEALTGYDNPFDVSKVSVDNSGQIYVLADSINLGAIVFSPEGEFLRFFGSNAVPTTAEVILNSIKKRFMTQKQISAMKKFTPTTFTNFDLDNEGFLFTVTAEAKSEQSEIVRKLNYTGQNILPDKDYGDLEQGSAIEGKFGNSFADIDVDKDGFINLLDLNGGKIFQYSQEGQMVAVFGSFGTQFGSFSTPTAIETIDDSIIVFDSGKSALMVFSPTKYAVTFRNAVTNMEKGRLDESLSEWKELSDSNTNSIYAYYGMGLVYDKMGDYKQAMHYFKLAGYNEDYSNALKQYRNEYIHENPLVIVLAVLVVCAICFVVSKIYNKKAAIVEGTAYSGLETKYGLPYYTVFHPIDGFENFKQKKNMTSALSATAFVILWFLAETFKYFSLGFSFNKNSPTDYSLLITSVSTMILFIVFVVANWSICTLFDGKGTFKEIYCVAGYSLIPYVLSLFLSTALSNVLTANEQVFVSLIVALGIIWTAFILLSGLYTIHEFSFLKLLLFLLFTVIAMIIIVFLAIVFYGLLQQTYNFIKSVVFEATLRNQM